MLTISAVYFLWPFAKWFLYFVRNKNEVKNNNKAKRNTAEKEREKKIIARDM